jgi:hypothetical protein
MSQQHNVITLQEDSRVDLTLQAYTLGQFRSLRRAAIAFNIKYQRLSNRLYRISSRAQTRPNYQKLTVTKEQTIIQYILNLDSRGFAPRLCEVVDIADKVLGIRGSELVSRH